MNAIAYAILKWDKSILIDNNYFNLKTVHKIITCDLTTFINFQINSL